MIKNIILVAFLLALTFSSQAQTTDVPAAEINSAPPALATSTGTNETDKSAGNPAFAQPRKIRYNLSAGTQFSPLFGTATYLEPSVLFPVSRRFNAFASVNMITTFGSGPTLFGSDAFAASYAPFRNQRYIVNAGGNYLVNDRLNLTGSIWRDISKYPLPTSPNVLTPGGTNGMLLRANYKVTEHLSISGGFRYSNGNGFNSMWYNPASPFGY